MNITSAQYEIASDGLTTGNDHIKAVVDGKTLIVPLDPDNTDYQAILEWVAKGNKIEEAE